MRIKIKKETVAIAVLITLVSVLNGAAGAQIIWQLARAYYKKKKREKENFDRAFGYTTLRVVLSRLKKDGLVENKGRIWQITEKGKLWLKRFTSQNEFTKKITEKKEPDLVVVFDVPEKERKKRDYLRLELVSLGFQQLQKSVWLGHGPLPENFLEYLRQSCLFSCVHIFSIKKYGTIS